MFPHITEEANAASPNLLEIYWTNFSLKNMERTVQFFEKLGAENTNDVISCLVDRVREGDIDSVVVASVSGRMATIVAEKVRKQGLKTKVVCVSGPKSWKKYPQYQFPLITRKEQSRLESLQVKVVNKYR